MCRCPRSRRPCFSRSMRVTGAGITRHLHCHHVHDALRRRRTAARNTHETCAMHIAARTAAVWSGCGRHHAPAADSPQPCASTPARGRRSLARRSARFNGRVLHACRAGRRSCRRAGVARSGDAARHISMRRKWGSTPSIPGGGGAQRACRTGWRGGGAHGGSLEGSLCGAMPGNAAQQTRRVQALRALHESASTAGIWFHIYTWVLPVVHPSTRTERICEKDGNDRPRGSTDDAQSKARELIPCATTVHHNNSQHCTACV